MMKSHFRCTLIYLKKPSSKGTINFVISAVVVGISMVALALHDFSSFAMVYLLPWVLTYLHLAMANWNHHVGCDYTSVYTSAFNNLNVDARKLGFNIGYHTAHHWYPGLHWSLLEEFHNTHLAPHVPEKYYVPLRFSSWRRASS